MPEDKESPQEPSFDFSFDNNTAYSDLDLSGPEQPGDIIELTDIVERGPGYDEPEFLSLSDMDMALGREEDFQPEEAGGLVSRENEEPSGNTLFDAEPLASTEENLYLLPEEEPQEPFVMDTVPAGEIQVEGLSEARIEEIVERVVARTVERVARETMTTVAEKLIQEAIDALKETLRERQN